MTEPRFTISIAVHNLARMTERCLLSILRTSRDYEVIVIDNGSTDETPMMLEKMTRLYPFFRVITNQANEGFIKAHNAAAAIARGEYLAVVNNDLTVVPGWLETMVVPMLRDPKVAQVGIRGACCAIREDGGGEPSVDQCDYIEASLLLMPTHVAKSYGPFSTDYEFAYFEDSDLSLRLVRDGYRIAQVDLPVVHLRAATANLVKGTINLDAIRERNRRMFFSKWSGFVAERRSMRSLIVRRRGAIGDVLLTTPVLRALHERYPQAKITFVTQCAEVLRDNPDVHQVTSQLHPDFKMFGAFYDLDLAYEKTPKRHIVEAYAETCRVTVSDFRPRLYPNAQERERAAALLGGSSRWVAIHPGPTGWPGRNWNYRKFDAVSRTLIDQGWKVVIVGNSSTSPVTADRDLRGKTTIHEMAALMEQASLFVGIDSFPMHVAAACDIPIVAVFGCIRPEYRLPRVLHMRGVSVAGLECLGCHHELPPPVTESGCRRDRVYCMEDLEPSRVLGMIGEVLPDVLV